MISKLIFVCSSWCQVTVPKIKKSINVFCIYYSCKGHKSDHSWRMTQICGYDSHIKSIQCLAKVFIPQSNVTELELFYKEEWTKMSVCTCAKLVETNHKRLEAVTAEKGGSTKYWLRGMNTYARHSFHIFICKKSLTPHIIFLPLHNYALLCVGLSHKIPVKYI